ncbi:SDR family NAD(P)-dependent oxidoreductase [Streptomyces somaliensis]|uniref:SDR family NAD(P)-dependent oxidoreductase n=1 Tax=Streptomyces somaliensis TaxID=78355 RepID=UPI0020CB7B87|nr:SDR family NAD(P)-dependent oxidoreductase [Streptomyces somaliensis]MCP9946797.1 SDR family NAD(P)-dependent oxidoreductase [Streptomyces somaliensis]MCP9963430.1 SDR family NAD(P)-dependent oxidoreductase [Streptomyces somaliensis]
MTFTRWKDQSVIVTGGTRGIGFGIAELFARQGATVLLTSRNGREPRTPAPPGACAPLRSPG